MTKIDKQRLMEINRMIEEQERQLITVIGALAMLTRAIDELIIEENVNESNDKR